MQFIKSNKNIILGADFNLRFGDAPLTLDKGVMAIGYRLPSESDLVKPDLTKVNLSIGVKKVIFTVPSLDTPVCEWQIKKLSDMLDKEITTDTSYYVVSVDTPFAQSRFIKENNINPSITFLSDYAKHQFMNLTGLKIMELNIFARAVIDCDEDNIVRGVIIPEDITQLP